jgi:hypothetical protein
MMSVMAGDVDQRLREVEMNAQSNKDKLSAHEDICAVRYENINESIEPD